MKASVFLNDMNGLPKDHLDSFYGTLSLRCIQEKNKKELFGELTHPIDFLSMGLIRKHVQGVVFSSHLIQQTLLKKKRISWKKMKTISHMEKTDPFHVI